MVVTDAPFDPLPRMAGFICRAVESVHDCGITALYLGQAVTLAFSSELAALNDELQYTTGAGPCLQALQDGANVESEDLGAETRWGGYPAAAVDCGVRSVLSVPIDAGEAGQGVLNLYSRTVDGFTDHDRVTCAEFAGVVADVLAATAYAAADAGVAERFHQAMRNRASVQQAVGVFMARHGCGPEEAFQRLRLVSREHGEDIYAAAVRIGAANGPGGR